MVLCGEVHENASVYISETLTGHICYMHLLKLVCLLCILSWTLLGKAGIIVGILKHHSNDHCSCLYEPYTRRITKKQNTVVQLE